MPSTNSQMSSFYLPCCQSKSCRAKLVDWPVNSLLTIVHLYSRPNNRQIDKGGMTMNIDKDQDQGLNLKIKAKDQA